MTRKTTGILWMLLCATPLFAESWKANYADLLEQYVSDSGVDYSAWKQNGEDLDKLKRITEAMAQPQSFASHDAEVAFHINAYNAWMLRLVLENYPISSVKEIGGEPFEVFQTKRIEVNGRQTSLDHVEKQILVKELDEPLIHFAVNCASESCPPLRPEPYRATELSSQLEEQARKFMRTPHAIKVDKTEKTVFLSKIFEWYQEDFEAFGGVRRFISTFTTWRMPEDYQIRYLDYDWSLNENS